MKFPKIHPSWFFAFLFLLIALGDLRFYDPFIKSMNDKAEAKRLATDPIYANDKKLEQLQQDMERQARELPLGEQLDLMIAAQKAKADTAHTASRLHGGRADAPLVNYVFHNWMTEHRMSRENLDLLVFKISRAGRPTIGQLKRYIAEARDCSIQERAGEDYDSDLAACKEFARLVNGKGHERVSPLFATANERY